MRSLTYMNKALFCSYH